LNSERADRIRELYIEVDSNLYDRISALRARGITLRDILLKGLEYYEKSTHTPKVNVQYSPCGVIRPYEYCWPPCRSEENKEVFEEARCFEVYVNGRMQKFLIAYGYREAFGRNRRRIVVYRAGLRGGKPMPVVEFAGTDDYNNTKNVVSIIKKPDRKFMKVKEVMLYPEYSKIRHYIVEHATAIKRGKLGYAALRAREDDIKLILYHALTQYKWRGKY